MLSMNPRASPKVTKKCVKKAEIAVSSRSIPRPQCTDLVFPGRLIPRPQCTDLSLGIPSPVTPGVERSPPNPSMENVIKNVMCSATKPTLMKMSLLLLLCMTRPALCMLAPTPRSQVKPDIEVGDIIYVDDIKNKDAMDTGMSELFGMPTRITTERCLGVAIQKIEPSTTDQDTCMGRDIVDCSTTKSKTEQERVKWIVWVAPTNNGKHTAGDYIFDEQDVHPESRSEPCKWLIDHLRGFLCLSILVAKEPSLGAGDDVSLILNSMMYMFYKHRYFDETVEQYLESRHGREHYRQIIETYKATSTGSLTPKSRSCCPKSSKSIESRRLAEEHLELPMFAFGCIVLLLLSVVVYLYECHVEKSKRDAMQRGRTAPPSYAEQLWNYFIELA